MHAELENLANEPEAGRYPHANRGPTDRRYCRFQKGPYQTCYAYSHLEVVIRITLLPSVPSYTTFMHVYNLYHDDGYSGRDQKRVY
jgi:hypothetical protein